MKQKKVWRYYCDYCKKSGCSKHHIEKHEASCTNNPNRICGICKLIGNDQHQINELVEALGDGTNLDNLRRITDNCPVCILSAIRQSKLQYFETDDEGYNEFSVEFNFKEELAEFWKQWNEDKSYWH